MMHDQYDPSYLRDILTKVNVIALVGASANPARPSYMVMKFLQDAGYQVIPVNPGLAGQQVLGQTVYATLRDIPQPIDMVDVFRASDVVPAVVDDALALSPRPSVIWTQLGVRHDAAAARAQANGLKVVMNRCPKIEYARLMGG